MISFKLPNSQLEPLFHLAKKHLCIDYQRLNDLIIKNWYPLLLISELLDSLGYGKQFISLNLTSIYYCMEIKKSNE